LLPFNVHETELNVYASVIEETFENSSGPAEARDLKVWITVSRTASQSKTTSVIFSGSERFGIEREGWLICVIGLPLRNCRVAGLVLKAFESNASN